MYFPLSPVLYIVCIHCLTDVVTLSPQTGNSGIIFVWEFKDIVLVCIYVLVNEEKETSLTLRKETLI